MVTLRSTLPIPIFFGYTGFRVMQMAGMHTGRSGRNTSMRFEERLRQERRRRHLSQEALAEALGTSPKSISRWEQGQVIPQAYARLNLSRFLGIPVEELFL